MARGKHKQLSDRRKELQAEISQMQGDKKRIEQLENVVAKLTQEQERTEQHHSETVGRLMSLLESQTSPKVAELMQLNEQLKIELGTLRQEHEGLHKKWQKILENLEAYFCSLGMTGLEAVEKTMHLIEPATANLIIADEDGLRKFEPRGIVAIQRARGQRN